MASHTPVSEWNESTGSLRAALLPTGDGSAVTRLGFRTVAWVSFAPDGRTCAVDVPDLPQQVVPAIPAAQDGQIVGHAWLDSGWLWIPLTDERPVRERRGTADVDLCMTAEGVASLSLRFVAEAEAS
ncbi:hypothetical protein GCM10018793_67180 [Streptomyces sulfonofaciens]|uniref:Uncharacterized protein n=1 Tax=Streptomyces sulfonofaciens TaxID=68272 RepID=A0A919L7X7_9ACTN|nr:hypothetical protein [Streptomyces sulfonofaciens]GHH88240.1 hypothetical protein GCM10018793_67180 [Streptomyces sulfonofaciens]